MSTKFNNDQKRLRSKKKNTEQNRINQCIRWTLEAGTRTNVFVVLFFSFRASLRLILSNLIKYFIFYFLFILFIFLFCSR